MVDKTGNYKGPGRPVQTIRIPVHMVETMNRITKTTRELVQELEESRLRKRLLTR